MPAKKHATKTTEPPAESGTPQDGTVRLAQVNTHGQQVQDYTESTESLHPLNEAS